MATIQEVLDRVNSIFDPRKIAVLMEEFSVIKRKREIEPLSLIRSLLKSSVRPDVSLASIAETLYQDEKVEISRQAIHAKIKKCEGFSAKLLELILTSYSPNKLENSNFNGLKDIILADSSEINQELKIQTIYSILKQKILHIEMTEATKNDQSYKKHIDFVKKNTLLIADLGYFALNTFSRVIDEGGFFLFRHFKSTSISDIDGNKIEINKFLSKESKDVVDVPILLGEAKIKCRLICIRLNQEQQVKRNQNIEKKRKRDRRLNNTEVECDKWNVFVTNLPIIEFNLFACYELYASRWQIELLFKGIKSAGFQIDKLNLGTKLGKVLFYYKLMMAVLICQMHDERENNISVIKLFKSIPALVIKNINNIWLWPASVIKNIHSYVRKFCKSSTYKNRKISFEKVRITCLS